MTDSPKKDAAAPMLTVDGAIRFLEGRRCSCGTCMTESAACISLVRSELSRLRETRQGEQEPVAWPQEETVLRDALALAWYVGHTHASVEVAERWWSDFTTEGARTLDRERALACADSIMPRLPASPASPELPTSEVIERITTMISEERDATHPEDMQLVRDDVTDVLTKLAILRRSPEGTDTKEGQGNV